MKGGEEMKEFFIKLWVTIIIAFPLIFMIQTPALAKYTITQLTDTGDCAHPQINDRGEVVWEGDMELFDLYRFYYEIFYYDGTNIIQLTDNDNPDDGPQINNNGSVVWKGDGEIFLYDGTTINQLTDSYSSVSTVQLNDKDEIVGVSCLSGMVTVGKSCFMTA
jgi:hypothetical protein